MAIQPQHIAREVIAANIRSLMGRHRVTQKRIGEVIHLTQGPVSERLSGKIAFDTDELLAIAAEFNVEVTALLEGISEQGGSSLPWIPTPTNREDSDISVTVSRDQLPLFAEPLAA